MTKPPSPHQPHQPFKIKIGKAEPQAEPASQAEPKLASPPKLEIKIAKGQGQIQLQPKLSIALRPQLSISLSQPKLDEIDLPELTYPELSDLVDGEGQPIQLDASQLRAVDLFLSGKSFVIIGKAGTGKSTIVQAGKLLLLSRTRWESIAYRIKGKGRHETAPSIATVAFTNHASDNIREKLVSHPTLAESFGICAPNITTIHNLLEYTVEFITCPNTGETKRRYYPTRDKIKKLEITHLVLEEASMVGVGDLSIWQQLFDALPSGIQLIFLGDINQLPPVIGKSILSYALQELPVAELTTVHRCALNNPIIRQALNCIEGRKIEQDWDAESGEGVRVFNGKAKTKLCKDYYQIAFTRLMAKMIEEEQFDPMVDMVLSPFFKPNPRAISACNLAKQIAGIMARKNRAVVYEIQTGFQRIYLAVGDRVMIDKTEGIVARIETNGSYTGKTPKPPSAYMDYNGEYWQGEEEELETSYNYDALNLDSLMDTDQEERKRAASHVVYIKQKHEELGEVMCSTLSDFGGLSLGYALSVHKAQGSEWPNVVLALHGSNSMLLFRELLYTGMTRAKKRLDILAQADVLEKARTTQRIKGNSLADKIEFFNGGYLDQKVEIQP